MAVEKGISENKEEETKVDEEQTSTEETPNEETPNIEIEGEEQVEEPVLDDFGANLAEEMDERTRRRLGLELISEYRKDKESRKDWEEGYTKGLDLLGVKYAEQTRPFKGASGVTHPLLSESATTFQATDSRTKNTCHRTTSTKSKRLHELSSYGEDGGLHN